MLHENLSFVCFFGFPVYLYYYSTVVTIRKVFFTVTQPLLLFPPHASQQCRCRTQNQNRQVFSLQRNPVLFPYAGTDIQNPEKKASQHNCAKRYGTTFTCAQDFSTDETGKRIPCRNSHPDQFHRQSHGIGNPAP